MKRELRLIGISKSTIYPALTEETKKLKDQLKTIARQKALKEKRQMEQMPQGSIHERLAWGARKSEMENQQRKKNKTKNRGMER